MDGDPVDPLPVQGDGSPLSRSAEQATLASRRHRRHPRQAEKLWRMLRESVWPASITPYQRLRDDSTKLVLPATSYRAGNYADISTCALGEYNPRHLERRDNPDPLPTRVKGFADRVPGDNMVI